MSAFYRNAPLPDTNSRQVAQTIRPPSSAILAIDSEDRYQNYDQARLSANPSSPYDFTIVKNENLMAGFFTRLGVTEIVLPWAVPNINLKTNKINVRYQVAPAIDPSQVTITLGAGFYTPAQIAARLQSIISVQDPSMNLFTMTYGGTPGFSAAPRFIYNTGQTGVTVAFSPMTNNSVDYPYDNTAKQLFDLLGFDDINTQQAQVRASNNTFCQAIKYVDIVSSQLTNSQSVKDSTSQPVVRDTLCRVYIADSVGTNQSTVMPYDPSFCPIGCAPTTLYRNFATPKMIQWIPNQNIPGYLSFQVYDDNGLLLSKYGATPTIYGTMDWRMTLLVTEA